MKNPHANVGDMRDTGSIPGLGRSPGRGYGNPFQYSCLENPMDRGAWRLQYRGLQRVRHNWSDLAHKHAREIFDLRHILEIFYGFMSSSISVGERLRCGCRGAYREPLFHVKLFFPRAGTGSQSSRIPGLFGTTLLPPSKPLCGESRFGVLQWM